MIFKKGSFLLAAIVVLFLISVLPTSSVTFEISSATPNNQYIIQPVNQYITQPQSIINSNLNSNTYIIEHSSARAITQPNTKLIRACSNMRCQGVNIFPKYPFDVDDLNCTVDGQVPPQYNYYWYEKLGSGSYVDLGVNQHLLSNTYTKVGYTYKCYVELNGNPVGQDNVSVRRCNDADQDGVCDEDDACPNRYGRFCHGCPKPACSECKEAYCPSHGVPYCKNLQQGAECGTDSWQYSCPWGNDFGDDTGKRLVDMKCDGNGNCNGHTSNWQVDEYCNENEFCFGQGVSANDNDYYCTQTGNLPPVVTQITGYSDPMRGDAVFTATATDLDGYVTKVEFFISLNDQLSTRICSDDAQPWTCSWNSVGFDGYRTITAVATDDDGAKGSLARSFLVDNIPPITNITAPAPSSVQVSDFLIGFYDYDNLSGLAACYYYVYNAGTLTVQTSRDCNRPLTITVGPGEDCSVQGTNKCRVVTIAEDRAGNAGQSERSFSIDYSRPDLVPVHDNNAPATAIVGQSVLFDPGIRNNGDAPANAFNLKWYVDGVMVGYTSHSTIPAQTTVMNGNSFFSWTAAAGTHQIVMELDTGNFVVESNENNNRDVYTVTVTSGGVCTRDNVWGNANSGHEYYCGGDGTYYRCRTDGSGYEHINLCRTNCGAASTCNNKIPGSILNSCSFGATYFRDACTATCQAQDMPRCEADFGCTADVQCDNVFPNSGDCDAQCNYEPECIPGQSRPCGTDAGACQSGRQYCTTKYEWGSCQGSIGPVNETCDDIDNDCDGTTDEGCPECARDDAWGNSTSGNEYYCAGDRTYYQCNGQGTYDHINECHVNCGAYYDCQDIRPGTTLQTCGYDFEYFRDSCNEMCEPEDIEICEADFDCIADQECDGVLPGTNNCDASCNLVSCNLPDLIITEMNTMPANPAQGQSFGIYATVQNAGNSSADPFCVSLRQELTQSRLKKLFLGVLNIYKFINGVKDIPSNAIDCTTSALGAGQSRQFQFTATLQQGAYTLTAKADENSDYSTNIEECNESNNYLSIQINVGPIACVDNDEDGFNATGGVCGLVDCNDNNANIYPGATELCNNADDNCNTQIDENLAEQQACGTGVCIGTQTRTCSAGSWNAWSDCSTYNNDAGVCAVCSSNGAPQFDATQDNDCSATTCPADGCGVNGCGLNIFGNYPVDVSNECSAIYICTQKTCNATCEADSDSDGYSTSCGECNDNNASINPGATEICNDYVDNDCDTFIDLNDTDCGAVCEHDVGIDSSYTESINGIRIINGSVTLMDNPVNLSINGNYTVRSRIKNFLYNLSSDEDVEITIMINGISLKSYIQNIAQNHYAETNLVNLTLPNGYYNITINANLVNGTDCNLSNNFAYRTVYYSGANITLPECSDTNDNDGDSLIDNLDPGCYDSGDYNPNDDNETDTLPECSDYFDNDQDGLIDIQDPDCYNETSYDPGDDDENSSSPFECSDTQDNDLDGFIDFPADIGCVNLFDDNETNPVTYQCSDNRDNDNDSFIDWQDWGCYNASGLYNPFDNNESDIAFSQCSDHADNDNDTAIDWQDIGCYNQSGFYNPFDNNESDYFNVTYECSDRIDNDLDNFTDFQDPGCWDSGYYDPFDDDEGNDVPGAYDCSDLLDNDLDGYIDWLQDPGCENPIDNNETDANVTIYQCNDGQDNDADTFIDWEDLGCYDEFGYYDPNDNNETNEIVTTYQCSDGLDNDNDTAIDWLDRGCYDINGFYNPNDNNETDVVIPEPPVVTLHKPEDGNLTRGTNSSIPFMFNVTDDIDLNNIVCNLIIDNILSRYNSSVLNNSITIMYANMTLSNGTHSWRVSCTDTDGLTGTSVTWTFTIDNIKPTIAIETANGSTTFDTTPDIYFNVTDNYAPTLSCSLYMSDTGLSNDFTHLNDTIATNGTSSTMTPNASLANGLWYYYINCTDTIGNTNQSKIYTIIISPTYCNKVEDSTIDGIYYSFMYVNEGPIQSSFVYNCSDIVRSIITQSTIDNSNITDSTIENSTTVNSTYVGSELHDSYVENAYVNPSYISEDSNVVDTQVINSNITNSTVLNSTVTNSLILDSEVISSIITNSPIINSLVEFAQVINYWLESGDFTHLGVLHNAPPRMPLISMTVNKTAPGSATAGDNITYTINYRNDGIYENFNVNVSDILPNNVTFISSSPAPNSVNGNTLTWNLGTLFFDDAGTISILVHISDLIFGTISNNFRLNFNDLLGDPWLASGRVNTTVAECVNGQTRQCGTDVGECAFGNQTCVNNVWGNCLGGVQPANETCDTLDNDCDNLFDESLTRQCGTTNTGDCTFGLETCSFGSWYNCTAVLPATETCDGHDNDCNGVNDNGFTTENCEYVCEASSYVWTGNGGALDCCGDNTNEDSPYESTEVSCDGHDNDCDGFIDEDLSRSCGTNVGECQSGTQTCSAGAWGTCVGEIGSQPELCDGLDNDCDSVIDNGFALDVCQYACTDRGYIWLNNGGELNCCGDDALEDNPYEVIETSCDGRDNDCDGLIDENVCAVCDRDNTWGRDASSGHEYYCSIEGTYYRCTSSGLGYEHINLCESAHCGAANACGGRTPVSPGATLQFCNKYGRSYFQDRCTSSCQLEDIEVCKYDMTMYCVAEPECDGVLPGTDNCTTNCKYNYGCEPDC